MTETDISKRVAKVAVRVVQSGFERVFTSALAMGELRTYNGSRLLKLVIALSIYILRKAHIEVAEDLYHQIERGGVKADHGAHKGG
jgi:hypothetical protein